MIQKCVWTFTFQIALLVLLASHFISGDRSLRLDILEDIFVGSPKLNLTRLVCALLMHLSILPEISAAKEMLSFSKKNITSFSEQRYEFPMLFAFFKLFGGFTSFFTNMFCTLTNDTVFDVIKDFVAVQIISELS